MRHEDPRTADTRAWLRKAHQDIRAAEVDLAAEPPLLDDTLFHCQQAVEKSLKAFLSWNDRAFRKTHSIEEIGEACISVDASLSQLVDDTAHMTEYAWAFRYRPSWNVCLSLGCKRLRSLTKRTSMRTF